MFDEVGGVPAVAECGGGCSETLAGSAVSWVGQDRVQGGGEFAGGGVGVERVHDDVGGHAEGEVGEGAEGGEVALQGLAGGVHAGERAVGVHTGAAVAGQVLEDREDAAREEGVGAGAGIAW